LYHSRSHIKKKILTQHVQLHNVKARVDHKAHTKWNLLKQIISGKRTSTQAHAKLLCQQIWCWIY